MEIAPPSYYEVKRRQREPSALARLLHSPYGLATKDDGPPDSQSQQANRTHRAVA